MLQNHVNLKQIRFSLLKELRQIYTENESDSIARLILEHVGYPLSVTLREPDLVPAPSISSKINAFAAEIRSGIPVQYILGVTKFCNLPISVDQNVLIPRPETEEMVEHIKKIIPSSVQRIIDLGTGSGCIALALKQHFSEAEVWGVDNSRQALLVAGENGRKNKLHVNWGYIDLLNLHPIDQWEAFELVVSNPPYVRTSEREKMSAQVLDFEPEPALFVPDKDPLVFYRAIVSFCKLHLAASGEIWVEINEQLGQETARLFMQEGFGKVQILKDIHEKHRFIHARR